ncbi:MAG: nucleoside-triphosphatase [Candidatus Methylomirabilaceae bacterium]
MGQKTASVVPLTALLITGRPGIGKTTALRRVAAALSGWTLAGFYTEEIREAGERKGFRAVTFDGVERIMAHVGLSGPHRVGKYGVDVSVIDQLAGSELTLKPKVDLYLVDEIGKMECHSKKFVSAMERLLASRRLLVAAIAQKGGGFIAEAKEAMGAEIWELTRANRDELPDRIVAWLHAARASAR